MMKLASTCPTFDMGAVWGLLCLHPNTIKPSYYYYITPTVVGWCIVILRFFFSILIILILPHIFVRSISRRCLDQILWNLVGISYAMWSCAFNVDFFKMAAIAMETAKMVKNWKTQKWQTVSMATAAILKFQDLNVPVEMGIYLPVKFSKDRIINLWEFGRTISQREEEEEEE